MADGPRGQGAMDHVPDDAFAALGNEVRIGILRALWDEYDPFGKNNAVPFSELADRAGIDDSGNFNYHLGQLTDHFVRQTDDGYELRVAGLQVVRAILAGTFTRNVSLPSEAIDERCVYCGGIVEMAYDDAIISVRCTDCGGVVHGDFPSGTYMQYGFPAAGLRDRTREAAVDAAHILYDSKITPMMKGVCPECAGQITRSYDVCSDHDPGESGLCPRCDSRFEVWTNYECEHCAYGRRSAMWFAALTHPAVIAFYHDHGLEETVPFRKLTWENARFVKDISETVLDTDPYRFRVTIPVGDDRIVVEMDEELAVTDVSR